MKQVLDDGRVVQEGVEAANLGMLDKKQLTESILKVVEEDNERFLLRLRDRTNRVEIDILKIEVLFEHLSVEGDAYVGSRLLPTLLNASINTIEGFLGNMRIWRYFTTLVELSNHQG